MLASPAPEGWPLPISRFEAESGSLSLRLAPYALQGSDHRITQLSPPARLHVLQAFHMVSSFQPTREARFILTHRSTRGRHSMHDLNFITGTIIDSAMRIHTSEERFAASGEPLTRAIPASSASSHSPREMMLTVAIRYRTFVRLYRVLS